MQGSVVAWGRNRSEIGIKESFGLMEMVSILNMVLGIVQVDEV